MKKLSLLIALVTATPALAASQNPFSGDFWTLTNTNLIVLLGFLVFVGILIWKKVPALLGKMLDDRAAGIKSDLDEARALRDEAQSILASYERKQREVQNQADAIVAQAKKTRKLPPRKRKRTSRPQSNVVSPPLKTRLRQPKPRPSVTCATQPSPSPLARPLTSSPNR